KTILAILVSGEELTIDGVLKINCLNLVDVQDIGMYILEMVVFDFAKEDIRIL
ncbi:hypothetical protein ACJX0J_007285, partial [Zea mays]